MNVTGVPAQTEPCGEGVMLTAGVIYATTVMVIVLEEAMLKIKQVPPVTVISQLTAFPLTSEDDVKVLDAPICILLPLILKL